MVFANGKKLNACDKILKLRGIESCTPGVDGSVEKIYIISSKLNQNSIDKLSKYDIKDISVRVTTFAKNLNLEPIGNITNLSSIDLRLDGIEEAPENFIKYFKNARYVYLYYLVLNQKTIEEISALTETKKLSFNKCTFEQTLDYSPLKKLTKLEVLEMDEYLLQNKKENVIAEIPEFVFELKSLKELIVTSSDIRKIPEKLSNLKNLEVLDLNDNDIDDVIPESLNTLPELREIDFTDNINVKGKTLTNPKLTSCKYDSAFTLCEAKEMECLKEFNFKKCSDLNDHYTTNGQCGNGNGKCKPGYCCSKDGWCGKTESHCSVRKGCQYQFGTCNDEPNQESKNGRCGEGFGKCPKGQCCGKDGYCGVTDKHCLSNLGCQSEFGDCHSNNLSVDGRCGVENGARCPEGQCCSKHGWCGKGSNYCDAGCQLLYGDCNKSKV
ncbi:hypothetical protein BCR36DRAFT_582884 [Piromyces finnis]|uniref:Chitin-binding type-1 domain-containing protein n=1 Tax=Piromyces finnis TaxID=1754191 RepID=A0A1Y1VC50_9FUNG|nr:hypothetical protein BCR36DRAFT_582884 [Piromyces finnis]|eukprot:ORX51846.1 hypothetical protein BCR36DRAFT_582884 [Piromyces finnis]